MVILTHIPSQHKHKIFTSYNIFGETLTPLYQELLSEHCFRSVDIDLSSYEGVKWIVTFINFFIFFNSLFMKKKSGPYHVLKTLRI